MILPRFFPTKEQFFASNRIQVNGSNGEITYNPFQSSSQWRVFKPFMSVKKELIVYSSVGKKETKVQSFFGVSSFLTSTNKK